MCNVCAARAVLTVSTVCALCVQCAQCVHCVCFVCAVPTLCARCAVSTVCALCVLCLCSAHTVCRVLSACRVLSVRSVHISLPGRTLRVSGIRLSLSLPTWCRCVLTWFFPLDVLCWACLGSPGAPGGFPTCPCGEAPCGRAGAVWPADECVSGHKPLPQRVASGETWDLPEPSGYQ